MADLIQAFFERELSEAEADSLGDLLRDSPDSALQFEGLLEGHYLATGLSYPQLPVSLLKLPGAPGGWGSAGSLKLLFLLAIAGLGFLAVKFRPLSSLLPSAPIAALSQAPAFSTAPAPARTLSLSTHTAKSAPVEPQEVGPTAEGEELSVVVGAQEKTLVTVRILDQAGREVRNLYTGFVQPGHWSFRWDGDLTNGAPAPAGDYQIDVQSGVSHEAKEIRIKPN